MSRTAVSDQAALACRQTLPDSTAAVSWVAPSDQRQRDALANWCEAVGPVVFAPSPRETRQHPIDRLAVVTWNTHVGAGDLDRLIEAVRRGSFTGGAPADDIVLLLQEMYRHGEVVPAHPAVGSAIPSRIIDARHADHAHDAARFAQERGLAVFYVPSMRNGLLAADPEDRGNAIVSTLPLAAPAVIELPLERQRRAVAVAEIGGRTSDGHAWQLRLANVHLDTALALTSGGPLNARRRQADALVTALTRELSFAGPTIVAGDFNTWMGEREPAIRVMRAAFPAAPPVQDGATWRGPLGLHSKLDYVFAAGALRSIRVQRLPDRFGSDHYPVLAIVSF